MDNGIESKRPKRCVVWHRGSGASEALLNALSLRGLVIETSGSGHEVLAMGCAQQRKGRGLIVVLDGDGEALEMQGRVIEGMERFCPSALVWVYEEGANPPMRGFVGRGGRIGVGVKAGNGVAASRQGESVGNELRLSGNVGGMVGGVVGKNGLGLTASDVLDQDELAALLNPSE